MKGLTSLQGRLAVLLLVSVPLIWLMATGFAVYAAHHEVDELYDTQLTLFARQLLTVQLTGEDDERPPTLPDTKHLIGRGDAGGTDDDDIGVAVWDQHGALLLADGKGKRFTYDPERRGFFTISGKHEHDWRLFYLLKRRMVHVWWRWGSANPCATRWCPKSFRRRWCHGCLACRYCCC
ncbi:sensor histidine kinase N-terminal domain-containing protein [Paludibacterium denitrificans]|uniref:sensor histidine kinase N-terminal domain-containing protein n=1 Tax=Paludibacterium denitrificans TaxID=2675226 RepID=UPI001E5F8810|nr:sensor histidine kinase N-terminal domain-containing protein [Paludibacterium denitrificans]